MKTAVSIPDDLFKKAEKLAKKQEITRSKLYAAALRQYLATNWREEMTRRTNAACDELDTSMPPAVERAVIARLRDVEW